MDVAMKAEYGDNDDYRIRKWTDPVVVGVYGTPSDKDREILEKLFETLNSVPGFPGISEAPEGDETITTEMHFLDFEDYEVLRSDYIEEENTGGFANASYLTATNGYWQAVIGIRTDTEEKEQIGVIEEELIQSLGLLNDSYLDPESLFYQGYNEPEWPTELDWVLVKCLYHPSMVCGMTADEAEAVLPTILVTKDELLQE